MATEAELFSDASRLAPVTYRGLSKISEVGSSRTSTAYRRLARETGATEKSVGFTAGILTAALQNPLVGDETHGYGARVENLLGYKDSNSATDEILRRRYGSRVFDPDVQAVLYGIQAHRAHALAASRAALADVANLNAADADELLSRRAFAPGFETQLAQDAAERSAERAPVPESLGFFEGLIEGGVLRKIVDFLGSPTQTFIGAIHGAVREQEERDRIEALNAEKSRSQALALEESGRGGDMAIDSIFRGLGANLQPMQEAWYVNGSPTALAAPPFLPDFTNPGKWGFGVSLPDVLPTLSKNVEAIGNIWRTIKGDPQSLPSIPSAAPGPAAAPAHVTRAADALRSPVIAPDAPGVAVSVVTLGMLLTVGLILLLLRR